MGQIFRLSKRQAKIISFIGEQTFEHEKSGPTLRRIADHLGVKSTANISKHVDRLCAYRCILKNRNGRIVGVTDLGWDMLRWWLLDNNGRLVKRDRSIGYELLGKYLKGG